MMRTIKQLVIAVLLALTSALLMNVSVMAQDLGMMPKYGGVQKNEVQLAADKEFMADVDKQFGGDRIKGSEEIANRGWQLVRQGNPRDAMRRFNQAWLLDEKNGIALWGMAVLQLNGGNIASSLALYSEAADLLPDDVNFHTDHAKLMGFAGAQTKDQALLTSAFEKFAQIAAKVPDNTLNFQNWAITLFYISDYKQAWQKVKLAQGTTKRELIDANFIAALRAKMPQP